MIESLNELRNNQTLRHSITARDYLFGLLLALDIKKAEAYRLVYNINSYPFALTENEFEKINKQSDEHAKRLVETDEVKELVLALRSVVDKHVTEYYNKHSLDNSEFYELTEKDLKMMLAKGMRRLELGDGTEKDLAQLLKIYFDKFVKKNVIDEDDTDKVIIIAPHKKEAVCISCNREIDILLSAPFECPYCGKRYDLRGTDEQLYSFQPK